MWTILFSMLMFFIFGKILVFAIRAAWGVSKVVVSLILLPLFLVGLVLVGLVKLALPILLIIGLYCLFALSD